MLDIKHNILLPDMTINLELGDLPNMIGVELRICQILAERAFNQASHTQVSPGTYMILSLIQKNPGQKQTTLAESVKLDRSTMVPIIDQLEIQGWVERRSFAGDRRAHAIHLTEKGNIFLNKLEKSVSQLEQVITKGMGQTDRKQLLKLLKKLQHSLQL